MSKHEDPDLQSKFVPSLDQFQGEHDRMMALFATYQCGLMSLDLEEARAGLELLRFELTVHVFVEDTVLMPLFKALDSRPEGAMPEFFEKEHGKLNRLLEGLFLHLAGLEQLQEQGELTRKDALVVIEAGFSFKHLFEHHTSREDKAFYPPISTSQTLAEREQTWRLMDAAEAGARERLSSARDSGEIGELS